MELREREKKLTRDQLDGLNLYTAGKAMINDTFDRYIKMKPNLRDSTRSNYTYMYSRFVRNDFGKKKLIDIKYSDIVQYYLQFTRSCIQLFRWQSGTTLSGRIRPMV